MMRRPSAREKGWHIAFMVTAMAYTVTSWFVPALAFSGWPFLALGLFWGHRIDNRERDWRIEQLEQRIAEFEPTFQRMATRIRLVTGRDY